MQATCDETDDFALCTVLDFDDDTLAVQLIHRGSKKSCVEIAEITNAISYNGPKRVRTSVMRWMPFAIYEKAIKGEYQ